MPRRVSIMFWHVRLVMVPALCASHENVGVRFEPARIVQGADAKPDEVRASPNLHVQRCTAITAEDAEDVIIILPVVSLVMV